MSDTSNINWEPDHRNRGAATVMLFIHGMNCDPPMFKSLFKEIGQHIPDLDLLIPSISLKWNRFLDLEDVSKQLADELELAIEKSKTKSVIICGHSAGGVLAQAVCLELHERGADRFAPIRLVAIAPMTRGWEISHHLPLLHKIGWSLGLKVGNLMQSVANAWAASFRRPAPALWILQLRRGSPFLVNLRLRWLRANCENLVTYVLLGSVDEIISWRDMVDEVVAGGRIKYRQVPYSNHAEVVDIEDDANDGKYGAERKRIIIEAITQSPDDDSEDVIVADEPPSPVDSEVVRVVFVIHGIRDEGHWTQKIAAQARACFVSQGSEGRIATETSSYGYFSMLQFLNPSARRHKIHWLMDRYVEARRRYPNAKFSFIGHSNGTYLLAQALQDYRGVCVERVAFAGSVVTSRYDWNKLIEAGRVKQVMNLTATSDWVVSFFPRLAEIFPPLRFLVGDNLGGAGVVSFTNSEHVWTEGFVEGQHGAAIAEFNWKALADYAVSGATPPPRPSSDPTIANHFRREAKWPFRRGSGPIATCGVIGILLAVLAGLGWLAWLNPVVFWCGAIAILSIFVLGAVVISSRADHRGFAGRRHIQVLAGWCLGLGVGLTLLWWFVPLLSFGSNWLFGSSHAMEPVMELWRESFIGGLGVESRAAIQAVSVVMFVSGVYRVMTKV